MVVLSDYFLRAASLNSELLKPEGVVFLLGVDCRGSTHSYLPIEDLIHATAHRRKDCRFKPTIAGKIRPDLRASPRLSTGSCQRHHAAGNLHPDGGSSRAQQSSS